MSKSGLRWVIALWTVVGAGAPGAAQAPIARARGPRTPPIPSDARCAGPPALRRCAEQPIPLSLAEAVTRATEQAPSVALARERTTEAEERVRQARGPLLPNVSASAAWLDQAYNIRSFGFQQPTQPGQDDLVGPFDNVDARLRLTQALFDYPSIVRVRASRSQLAAVAADGGVAVEGAAYTAALAYLRAARADARLAARRADSALAAELVTLAQAQYDAGVTPAIDVTRARTQLAASAGAVLVTATERERALIDLARALGLDARTPLALADSLTDRTAATDVLADPDVALGRAVAGRPDLLAEIARAGAAQQAASAISAERLPRLELAADYGLNGPTVSDAIGTGRVGVQLTVPIFDGLRREGRLAEQRAVAREADIRAADARRQIGAEVQTALLELRSAAAQRDIATERLGLAQAELDQARERFAAGVVGNIEVIAAQVSLINARDGEIDARFTAAAARAALARAVGAARRIR